MTTHLFLVLVLFYGAFAISNKDSVVLPKSLKQAHFSYEGTWNTQRGEIPVNGELFLSLKGNKLYFLDTSNLEWEGKTFNVRSLMLVDIKMKTKDSYVTINNRCLVSKFSKAKGTFPRYSGWKEIGNNKFEITSRNRVALKKILDPKLVQLLADRAEKTHDFKLSLLLTLKKNKISEAELRVFIDNEEVATKSIQVTENIEGKIDQKVFSIPSSCKNAAVAQQRKSLDLQMRLLGIDLDEENEQQTEGEVQEESTTEDQKDTTGSQSKGEMKESDEKKEVSDDNDMEKENKDEEQDDVEDDDKSKKLDDSKKSTEMEKKPEKKLESKGKSVDQ